MSEWPVKLCLDVSSAVKGQEFELLQANGTLYVPVVQCGNCAKRHHGCPMQVWCGPDDNDFCSRGELKQDD